ncbi:MFS transporter permease [Alteromonas sediminis]|uniref:MFS transporter permease n=1 Tax=Alteromonas sediminis TaxID=2259342 RepID=A0A3N5XY76_9ALTE|nr:MFS transporter permease [Alteromonas sediminis]
MDENQRFRRLVGIASLTKLCDVLVSAKTSLPWLLSSIGAPAWLISVLVPIREAGALIPQWPIKQNTSDIRNRLLLWRAGTLVQAVSIGLILPMAIFLPPLGAGVGIVLMLSCMSLGRSLCSLTMKDIQGHNINKGKRGKLNGMATSISGLLSLLTALLLVTGESAIGEPAILVMIATASALFVVGLPLSKSLHTHFEKQDSEEELQALVSTLQHNVALKHLVISRCLLLHGALVAPFFVSLSSTQSDQGFTLPFFICASALAAIVSANLWGQLSDKSAVFSLRIGSIVCALTCFLFMYLPQWQGWTAIGCFFLLNVGYEGIRNGRKTYVLDIAEGEERTQFVAVGNTIVGVVLLLLGGLYAGLYTWIGSQIVFVMATAMIAGMAHTHWLKKEK